MAGNPYKCRMCKNRGGRDGYCKRHRPTDSKLSHPMRRENFMDYGVGFTSIEERTEFGKLRDFGINRRW